MPSLRTLLLALTLSSTAFSQTLARPGWAGSGMNSQPWWKHAVLYQLDPKNFSENGLKSIPTHLDYLQSLGIDAILLTNTAPDSQTILTTQKITPKPQFFTKTPAKHNLHHTKKIR